MYAGLAWLLSACAAPVYHPNPHNVPSLERGGEAEVAVGLGLNGAVLAQGAVSPLRHVFLHGSVYTRPGLEQYHHYAEAGLGTYYAAAPSEGGDQGAVVLSAATAFGAGRGRAQGESFDFKFESTPYVAMGAYRRWSAQAYVGLRRSAFPYRSYTMEVGLSYRLANVHMHRFNVDDGPGVASPRVRGWFNEPSLLVRFWFDTVRLDLQGGVSRARYPMRFEYRQIYIAAGVRFPLHQWFRQH